MGKMIITGGRPLRGTVKISGAKNAVLPIMAASLLTAGECILRDIPHLADVYTMNEVLTKLGAEVKFKGRHELLVNSSLLHSSEAPYTLVRKMRASFLIMGPLLARTGYASMFLPGGCSIGTRPIDLHLKGLASLGASISIGHRKIEAVTSGLKGAKIYLDFPSVGATENIMMAATLAKGRTVIENAAEEPEIVDLGNYLNSMGAKVTGAGTNIIKIEGVRELSGTYYHVIPDRIEAGTYMVAAVATGGEILIENIITDHLKPVVAKLLESGAQITEDSQGVRVYGHGAPRAVDLKTLPYPGFPTDMQAQMTALLSVGLGTSTITETVFENRFLHIQELNRMGADIAVEGNRAVVKGVEGLSGVPVTASDLRAGAALVIAGLMAEGETELFGVHHLDRGYEDMVSKLRGLGAKIYREKRPTQQEAVCD